MIYRYVVHMLDGSVDIIDIKSTKSESEAYFFVEKQYEGLFEKIDLMFKRRRHIN